MEDLKTKEEIKAILHVKSDTTIWRLEREGRLPSYQAGRRKLYKVSEVLEALKVPTKAA
jgi:hypothetical protein